MSLAPIPLATLLEKDVVFITTKNIELATHAGFCYGVKRAVETVKKLKEQNSDKNIYVLGELIHNTEVIKELESLGIKTVDELPENGTGICVIRSHGASYKLLKEIENKGYEIVDLTCPDVKKVQNKAIELVREGYFLIILGKTEHPEVMAIEENAKMFSENPDDVFVAVSLNSLKEIEDVIKSKQKIGVVVQTTQRIEFLDEVISYLLPISKDLKVLNTICASTSLRQSEAKTLAQKSDLIVVVGSKKSANTTHLAEILSNITKTIHIENHNEISKYLDEIKCAKNIGVTAGASTPDYTIREVITNLKGE